MSSAVLNRGHASLIIIGARFRLYSLYLRISIGGRYIMIELIRVWIECTI
jgi:hypothetical protein